MKDSFEKMLKGYEVFRQKYAVGDQSVMQHLSRYGQQPQVMVIACCDSRVDPALILQCEPGDLFVVRNVANIVPPYEKDGYHHGISAALEFGICFLNVKHLVLFGHSQCGGIQALLNSEDLDQTDFIKNWVSIIRTEKSGVLNADQVAQLALQQSNQNCLTFPWIKEKMTRGELIIHQWFFDIKTGQISTFCNTTQSFEPLKSKTKF